MLPGWLQVRRVATLERYVEQYVRQPGLWFQVGLLSVLNP